MLRYTSQDVRSMLCDGCRHGLPVRKQTDGTMAHVLAGRTVASCTAVAWNVAERRESNRLRMQATRERGKA
jgi:hypothetical protein